MPLNGSTPSHNRMCTHTHRQTDTCINASKHAHTHTHTHTCTSANTHLHPHTFQCRNVDTVRFKGKLWQSSSDVDLGREDSARKFTHTHTKWQPSCMPKCTIRGHTVTEAKGCMHKDPHMAPHQVQHYSCLVWLPCCCGHNGKPCGLPNRVTSPRVHAERIPHTSSGPQHPTWPRMGGLSPSGATSTGHVTHAERPTSWEYSYLGLNNSASRVTCTCVCTHTHMQTGTLLLGLTKRRVHVVRSSALRSE